MTGTSQPVPRKSLGGLLERPAVRDVVTHALPRPLAARSPRVRGNQAKCLHPRPPLPVVVTAPGGRAKVRLPLMRHFMHEHGERVESRRAELAKTQ